MNSVTNKGDVKPWSEFFGRRGFWAGVAMAAPFYAEFFSWRWALFLGIPLFLILIVKRERVKRPPLAILPMILLMGLHATALLFTATPFADQVVKDLIITSFLLFAFLFADEDVFSGFFSVLIPLALMTAGVGLLKGALLDRGYILALVADNCAYYPAGSALCVNYNNLGFMWLVAALGCMRTRFWWAIPVLVAAGALSSSRRFVVLMMFLPIFWIVLQGRPAIGKALFVVLLSVLIVNLVSDTDSSARFRLGIEPYEVLGAAENEASAVMLINRATPLAMLGTMADGTLGTASRLELWGFGASMIGLWPQGWSYHQIFSCRFSSCEAFSYPHMTILSAWISGGVIFAVVAIAFFGWPFWQILRARHLFASALFFATVPYVLISGDTVLSLPACVSCMLISLALARASYAMEYRQLSKS